MPDTGSVQEENQHTTEKCLDRHTCTHNSSHLDDVSPTSLASLTLRSPLPITMYFTN